MNHHSPDAGEPRSSSPDENGGAGQSPSEVKAAIDARDLESIPVKELTPEEQMALYEKDLKENDWGHQPC